MNKKNLMILTLFVSVLIISVVSAGITGAVVREGDTKYFSDASLDVTVKKIYQTGETEVVVTDKFGKTENVIVSKDGIATTSTGVQVQVSNVKTPFLSRPRATISVQTFPKSALPVEECETYILSEGGTNTFVINGQPVGIGFNEDGFWFDANQGPTSDLFSWNVPLGSSFTFLGQTITILSIDEEGMIVKIKVCPGEIEPPIPPTTGQCPGISTGSCRWVFQKQTMNSKVDDLGVFCGKNEIVFEGSCRSDDQFVGVLNGGLRSSTVTGKEWECLFENTGPTINPELFAGALCCKI